MNSDNSITSEQQYFQFKYAVSGSLAAFVLLQLFDGNGKLVAKGYEQLSLSLPKGLYQLHVFSNGKLEQQLIRLDKDFVGTWANVGTYSSIPSYFLRSSHEYYTETAKQWSARITISNISHQISENASLFIFFRYPDSSVKEQQQQVATSMGWRFLILNSNRQLIYRLQDDVIKEDKEMGWLAFHANLTPGIYYLVYNGPRKREIPLYVFHGWQTQFFLTFKRTPIFQTGRTQLVRIGESFEMIEQDNLELDMLLRNMQNGIYYVPPYLIEKTAHAKWENPMLAIVVCYVYLLGTEETNDNLFRIMIGNLEQRILNAENAPDLIAIRLLAAVHFKEAIPLLVLEEPCMLTAGIKTFIEQSALHPDTITMSEYCEEIITYLQNDSVWTSYTPLEYDDSMTDKEQVVSNAVLEDKFALEIDSAIKTVKAKDKLSSPKDWLMESLINQLSSKNEKSYSVAELALQFQVNPALVKDRINRISNLLDSGSDLNKRENESNTDLLDQGSLRSHIRNIVTGE